MARGIKMALAGANDVINPATKSVMLGDRTYAPPPPGLPRWSDE